MWIEKVISAVVPRHCPICDRALLSSEQEICTECFTNLPLTRWKGRRDNPAERIFWGQFCVDRANAWLHFHRGSDSRRLIYRLKYQHRPALGRTLGHCVAADLLETDFFEGLDAIVPIPLSPERQKERGFNQCELIVSGVAELTSLPVRTDLVERCVDNPTQTGLHANARRDNVEGIFRVVLPEEVKGRRLLLFDDVITTGATITSCAKTLQAAGAASISVLSLFIAGRHGSGPDTSAIDSPFQS